MARSSLPGVWAAVFAALNVAELTALCAVYDHVPQRVTAPYLVLASPTENALRAMGNRGGDITIELHIFTDSDQVEGLGPAIAIADLAIAILEGTVLTMDGFTLHGVQAENGFEAGTDERLGVTLRQYVQVIRVLTRAA